MGEGDKETGEQEEMERASERKTERESKVVRDRRKIMRETYTDKQRQRKRA